MKYVNPETYPNLLLQWSFQNPLYNPQRFFERALYMCVKMSRVAVALHNFITSLFISKGSSAVGSLAVCK